MEQLIANSTEMNSIPSTFFDSFFYYVSSNESISIYIQNLDYDLLGMEEEYMTVSVVAFIYSS